MNHPKIPNYLRLPTLVLLAALGAIFFVQPAQAADISVTNTDDSGTGSLRAAIDAAGLTAEADVITFDAGLNGQTIVLSSTLLVTSELSIDASALVDSIQVSGNDAVRVFYLDSGAIVTMTHLIIRNGATETDGVVCTLLCGGGIYVEADTSLTLLDSRVTQNFGSSGGGIYNNGTLVIRDSQIISNMARFDAGGLRIGGNVTIERSEIVSNTSGGSGGGGIYAETVRNLRAISSTIAYNTSINGSGGGIYANDADSFSIENSTIAHNKAEFDGSGLYFYSNAPQHNAVSISNSTLSNNIVTSTNTGPTIKAVSNISGNLSITLTNVTIAANSGGVGVSVDATGAATITPRNTLIVDSAGANCDGVSGNSSNLADDNTCTGFSQGDALLAPLTDNGGPTLTHVPQLGSAALGNGDTAVCQAAPIDAQDQRGEARGAAACDIGAVEAEDISLQVSMTKTVFVDGYREEQSPGNFNPSECPLASTITVPVSSTVKYCYTVTNTGNYTVSRHTLIDSVLGEIFTDVDYDLGPGASVTTVDLSVIPTQTLAITTTNVATWTASLAPIALSAPTVSVVAQEPTATVVATATVNISGPTLDQDNDGIFDNVEGTGDVDEDGIPNYLDSAAPTAIDETDQPRDNQRLLIPSIIR